MSRVASLLTYDCTASIITQNGKQDTSSGTAPKSFISVFQRRSTPSQNYPSQQPLVQEETLSPELTDLPIEGTLTGNVPTESTGDIENAPPKEALQVHSKPSAFLSHVATSPSTKTTDPLITEKTAKGGRIGSILRNTNSISVPTAGAVKATGVSTPFARLFQPNQRPLPLQQSKNTATLSRKNAPPLSTATTGTNRPPVATTSITTTTMTPVATSHAEWNTPKTATVPPSEAVVTMTTDTTTPNATPATAELLDGLAPITPATGATNKNTRRVTFAPSPQLEEISPIPVFHPHDNYHENERDELPMQEMVDCSSVNGVSFEIHRSVNGDTYCAGEEGMMPSAALPEMTSNDQNDFEELYQNFQENIRESTDRAKVARDMLLGMEVSLTSAHGELLLVHSEMVDLAEMMQGALYGIDKIVMECLDK